MTAAYPMSTVPFPAVRVRPPSASTAESLVLVALLLQIIGAVAMGIGMGIFLGYSILTPYNFWVVGVVSTVIVVAVGLVFLYLAYEYAYLRIKQGDYAGAQTPTLIIGIISLFFGIIPGILYLVGYAKLGDAIREQQGPPVWWYSYGLPPPAPPTPPPAARP